MSHRFSIPTQGYEAVAIVVERFHGPNGHTYLMRAHRREVGQPAYNDVRPGITRAPFDVEYFTAEQVREFAQAMLTEFGVKK